MQHATPAKVGGEGCVCVRNVDFVKKAVKLAGDVGVEVK